VQVVGEGVGEFLAEAPGLSGIVFDRRGADGSLERQDQPTVDQLQEAVHRGGLTPDTWIDLHSH